MNPPHIDPNEVAKGASPVEATPPEPDGKEELPEKSFNWLRPSQWRMPQATVCLGALFSGVALLITQWHNAGVIEAQNEAHKNQLEMRRVEFDALDRREMVKLALAQLSGGPKIDDEGNPIPFDPGKQALRNWALNTFNDYNEMFPINDEEALTYLRTGKGFYPLGGSYSTDWGGYDYSDGGYGDYYPRPDHLDKPRNATDKPAEETTK